jgi:hypothetical protein
MQVSTMRSRLKPNNKLNAVVDETKAREHMVDLRRYTQSVFGR